MTVKKQPLYKKIRYSIEALFIRFIFLIFGFLPIKTASYLGGFILRKIGMFLPPCKTAKVNISLAFPEKTDKEKNKIILAMWDNLGRVIAEYSHLSEILEHVEIEGIEHLEQAHNSGKPAIFFSAHIGNWEICPIVAKKIGLNIYPIYRRPNNTGVENILKKARGVGATELIPKGSKGAKKMLSVLKNNGALGILMDQKLNEGEVIPFFGIDAMTAPAIASFALKFSCPIYPISIERLSGCKFKAVISPPLDVKITDNSKKDIRNILLDINKQIEKWILKNPEQWLWTHKRWSKDKYYKR